METFDRIKMTDSKPLEQLHPSVWMDTSGTIEDLTPGIVFARISCSLGPGGNGSRIRTDANFAHTDAEPYGAAWRPESHHAGWQ